MALLCRRWRLAAAAAALIAAVLNVGLQEGGFVLLILALAFAGICVAVLVPGWVAGKSAAKHALSTELEIAAIEAARRQELGR